MDVIPYSRPSALNRFCTVEVFSRRRNVAERQKMAETFELIRVTGRPGNESRKAGIKLTR